MKSSYKEFFIPLYYKKCSRIFIRCKDPSGKNLTIGFQLRDQREMSACRRCADDGEDWKWDGRVFIDYFYGEMQRLSNENHGVRGSNNDRRWELL